MYHKQQYLIQVETDGSNEVISVNVNSFDNESSGNLFDGSFKGVKDGEAFCGVWYEKRTLGRDDNPQGILSYVSNNYSNVYCLQNL